VEGGGGAAALLPYQRYAPSNMKDFVGNGKAARLLLEWATGSARRGSLPVAKECVLLVGAPGTGKSLLARLAFKSLGYGTVEYNLCYSGDVKEALAKQSPRDVFGKAVGIIIDELHELTELQPLVLTARCYVPVVCTSNRRPRGLEVSNVIPLFPLSSKESVELARSVIGQARAAAGGSQRSELDLASMVEMCAGDARMITQNAALSTSNTALSWKDEDANPFEQCRRVLRGGTVVGGSEYAGMLMQENVYAPPFNIEGCARFSAAMARLDTFPLSSTQPWSWTVVRLSASVSISTPREERLAINPSSYFRLRALVAQARDDAAVARARLAEAGSRLPALAFAQVLYGKRRASDRARSGKRPVSLAHSLSLSLSPRAISLLPSPIYRLPSAIYHLPSTICHLPSTIYHPQSTISHLPSAIYHLPSTINHLQERHYGLAPSVHWDLIGSHIPGGVYPNHVHVNTALVVLGLRHGIP
jgi:hypothetical protein